MVSMGILFKVHSDVLEGLKCQIDGIQKDET